MDMLEEINKRIFSFTSVSVLIGVAGSLSSLVTMFINTNAQVSVKLLLFVIWLAVTIGILLLKVIYDLSEKTDKTPSQVSPIKANEKDMTLIIRKNDNFVNSIVVGCYLIQDEIERLAYIGSVHHVQDKFIQIRLLKDMGIFDGNPYAADTLKFFVIRPVIPIAAINDILNIAGEINE